MEALKTYIISLKKTHTMPLPRERKLAIQVVSQSFEVSRETLFGRLVALGCNPVRDDARPNMYAAEGGIRFNCLPAIGTIIAVVPELIVEALRKDPLVTGITEDRKLKLRPCAEG